MNIFKEKMSTFDTQLIFRKTLPDSSPLAVHADE
jgi:hypothetical protein